MEKTYESFSEKYIKEYKREEELLGITELSLTQREKFKLRDISDINDKVMYLKNIQKIDISNNYISKLILKKFPILSIIIASKNMISEVNLVLPKLKILDLSYNLVKTIPDFTKTPEITELNFSRNLISRITINDFSKLKQSLTKLDLSYNRINFDLVNDFISLVDGLKFFDLTEFSIQGNLFNEKNKSLINSYKSLISLSFKKYSKN
jgi:Ran GTPase-activating protein (RanGAP) involved in mRNA processing and transport